MTSNNGFVRITFVRYLTGHEIKTLDNLITRKVIRRVKKQKEKALTPVQIRIVKYLYDNRDKDIFQRDIEKKIAVRRSTASEILKVMEKNGMIKRVDIKDDLRVKKIILVDDYVKRIDELEKNIDDFQRELLQGINSEDLDIFFSVVDKMKENLSRNDEEDKNV